MKTKGVILVNPIMSEMEPGQKGFLHIDAIILIDNRLYIDTSYSVLEVTDTTMHRLEISRTGPGKEDFEIDFNIIYYFYNQKFNENEIKDLENDENIIGPYKIDIEIHKPSNYRNQLYPRMDLDELIDALTAINILIENADEDTDKERKKTWTGDKKELRELIKQKLDVLLLPELKEYEKIFEPVEEIDTNEMKNYDEDKYILEFIVQKVKQLKGQKTLEDMSIKELEEELQIANSIQNFEHSATIVKIIQKKKEL
ncbi:MAG: hypothetical protein WCL02_06915 [bacterium]